MSTAARKIRPGIARKKLVSQRFDSWLEGRVFELRDGTSLTRTEVAAITKSPCTRAARALSIACDSYGIKTVNILNRVGLDALLRCDNVGERAAWIAGEVLERAGFDVEAWIDRKGILPREAKIRLAYSRARRHKH